MKVERIFAIKPRANEKIQKQAVVWFQYAVALAAVALAAVARLSLDSWLGEEVLPFSFLYLAVAITAWWVGFRPALLALVLGLLVGLWMLVPPRHSLMVKGFAEVMEVILYLFVTGSVLFLVGSLRKAREKAQNNAEAALGKQRELEFEAQQRQRVEMALRENEARFRVMAETVPDILFTARPDGSKDYINPRFDAYTKLAVGADAETRWGKALYAEDRQHVSTARAEAVRSGKALKMEYRLRGADGRCRWFLERCRPVFDEHGVLLKWVGACTDIEDQKRYEELLEQRVAERTSKLKEMIEELEHFSYAIVHDMRAPLRAMQCFAGLIEQESGECLPPESLEHLRRIRIASARMDRLIQDSLNYSRAVRQSLPVEPVNLTKLLHGLFETYPNLQEHSSEIVLEGSLPPVLGNEAALTQCFSNLLHNALKFVAPGRKPHVRIWAEADDRTTRVWVEDNGIGIPPEVQHHLFGLFQRHSPAYEGTGMGLAIVKKLTERMGGKVGVESKPDKGSRFWLELSKAERGEQSS